MFEIDSPDVVRIKNRIYCKSFMGFCEALNSLWDYGYTISLNGNVSSLVREPAIKSDKLHWTATFEQLYERCNICLAIMPRTEGRMAHVLCIDCASHTKGSTTTVQVWNGASYCIEALDAPLPLKLVIIEAYQTELIEPSPRLHEIVIEAAGRTPSTMSNPREPEVLWDAEDYAAMGEFVRHFTTLDYAEWESQTHHQPSDPIEGTELVARACHPEPMLVPMRNFVGAEA